MANNAKNDGLDPETVVQRKKVTCYNCNIKGHYSSECKSGRSENQSEMFAVMANLQDDPMQHYLDKESWLVNSGATVHVTNDATYMRNVHMTNEKIVVGNGQAVTPKLAGNIYLVQKSTSKVLLLSNVLYVPNFQINLISIGDLIDKVTL